MAIDRQFRLARRWSNRQLRKVAPLFEGEIVNVSAGEDVDKEGATYDAYFTNKLGYYLTNWAPGSYRGYEGRENEYLLDLTGELPPELERRFDVAFNHTTLEHIYEVRTAFANLCRLSKDVVILIVPFSQVQHESKDFADFWRFTPPCLHRLFGENGFEVVYEAANNHFNAAVYLFFVAARDPAKWRDKMPAYEPVRTAGERIGRPLGRSILETLGQWARRFRSKLPF